MQELRCFGGGENLVNGDRLAAAVDGVIVSVT